MDGAIEVFIEPQATAVTLLFRLRNSAGQAIEGAKIKIRIKIEIETLNQPLQSLIQNLQRLNQKVK